MQIIKKVLQNKYFPTIRRWKREKRRQVKHVNAERHLGHSHERRRGHDAQHKQREYLGRTILQPSAANLV